MRLRILTLALLLASHSAGASDAVQVGRYLTVAPLPTTEQIDPLAVVIHVRFPRSVRTVGGAMQHLLPPSGYELADARHADPHLAILTSRPLPEVHRTIGPMALEAALTTLAGESWRLEVDPVHRLLSFRLHGPLRDSYSAAMPEVRKFTTQDAVVERWPDGRSDPSDSMCIGETFVDRAHRHDRLGTDGWRPDPAWQDDILVMGADRAASGHDEDHDSRVQHREALSEPTHRHGLEYAEERYGPVRDGETLLDIAYQRWPDYNLSRRGMVALLRANPEAFMPIEGSANMNLLQVGAWLEMPTEHAVRAIDRDDAERTIAQQHADWQRHARVVQ